MANWWQGKISQAFNPPIEPGEDIALPVGTPVTALQGGTVTSAVYGPFGGRVDVNVGGGVVEYYQHLDEIAPGLHVGSQITAGEALGDSGGQLAGGMHPNSPQNSTGPHIEVGETVGGKPVNPQQLIAAGPQTGGTAAAMASGSPSNPLAWLLQLLSPPGVAGVDNAVMGAASGGAGGGLVNISVPDPVMSLRDWFGSGVSQAKAEAQGAPGFWNDPAMIIPLVVAAIIVVVLIGVGGGTKTQTQPVPVPVPV